eukprot:5213205-Alexandrium_andersonii.AAC.1
MPPSGSFGRRRALSGVAASPQSAGNCSKVPKLLQLKSLVKVRNDETLGMTLKAVGWAVAVALPRCPLVVTIWPMAENEMGLDKMHKDAL